MSEAQSQFHIDPQELRELGFREATIQEALADEANGILGIAPSDELIERTIAACHREFATLPPV
ncbi:MAG: hypothetical protein ACKV0T_15600 [Planctomycetales bacterium]